MLFLCHCSCKLIHQETASIKLWFHFWLYWLGGKIYSVIFLLYEGKIISWNWKKNIHKYLFFFLLSCWRTPFQWDFWTTFSPFSLTGLTDLGRIHNNHLQPFSMLPVVQVLERILLFQKFSFDLLETCQDENYSINYGKTFSGFESFLLDLLSPN